MWIKRRYIYVAALLVPVSLVLAIGTGVAWQSSIYIDFSAYWLAASRLLDGASLYEATAPEGLKHLPVTIVRDWLYPPVFALLFIPLRIWPYTVAATLWSVGTLLVLCVSLLMLLETSWALSWSDRVLLIIAIASFQPMWYSFQLGQITPLLAAGIALTAVGFERGQDQFAGSALTIATLVKPVLLPAGAVLLVQIRRLSSAIMAGAAVLISGVALIGVGAHQEYLTVLLTAKSGRASVLLPISQYHYGYFEPIDILGPLSWGVRITVLVLISGLAISRSPSTQANRGALAAGVAAVPLVAPEAYSLSFLYLLPVGIVILFERRQWWPWVGAAIAASHVHSWVMLGLSNMGVATPVAALLQPGLYATIILLGLSIRLLSTARTSDRVEAIAIYIRSTVATS